MPTDLSNGFRSVLAAFMEKFLQEKHACGYAYHEATRILRRLDDFLVQEGLTTQELPGSIARKWLAKKAHESAETQRQRITVTRHFSRFLLRLGYSAYVPDSTLAARNRSSFVPRMLTDKELRKFFQAVDALEPTARSPLRHLIMPEVFRLLYGCGFRVREVLKLRVRDVDLNQGIITVIQAAAVAVLPICIVSTGFELRGTWLGLTLLLSAAIVAGLSQSFVRRDSRSQPSRSGAVA